MSRETKINIDSYNIKEEISMIIKPFSREGDAYGKNDPVN